MNKEDGKEFYISYRGEFEAVVIAKNEEEAKEKFKNGNAEIKCSGDLWEEYMKIESDDEVVKMEIKLDKGESIIIKGEKETSYLEIYCDNKGNLDWGQD